jgi:hypothetical protein
MAANERPVGQRPGNQRARASRALVPHSRHPQVILEQQA